MGVPPWLRATLGKCQKPTPRFLKNIFSEVFHSKFLAINIKWTKWGQHLQLDCGFAINAFVAYLVKTQQSIDFIKPNVNWTHKVKYINQINGGLIMFSHNKKLKNIFFKLDQLWTIFTESLQKKEHNQNSSVFKALR